MKKSWKIFGLGSMLALTMALGSTAVMAQTATDTELTETGTGYRGPGFREGGIINTIVDLLGLTRDEVVENLREGTIPLDLVEANGVESGVLIDELVENAREQISERVNSPLERRENKDFGRGKGLPIDLTEALDLTRSALNDALEAGSTIAELAADASVDLDALVDEYLTEQESRLAEVVADGRIDQETADSMLEQAEMRIDNWLNGDLKVGMPLHGSGFEGKSNRAPFQQR